MDIKKINLDLYIAETKEVKLYLVWKVVLSENLKANPEYEETLKIESSEIVEITDNEDWAKEVERSKEEELKDPSTGRKKDSLIGYKITTFEATFFSKTKGASDNG